MLPIYAPRYSRVLYQQEEAFRARAGSSTKSTTSCDAPHTWNRGSTLHDLQLSR
ncbi:hypothetical protein VTO73DRAFT_3590 [Trametes versicolor]